MNQETQPKSVQNIALALVIALALGVVFNYLFFEQWIGLQLLVFTVLISGTFIGLSHHFKQNYKDSWWLVVLMLFFATMGMVRANETLLGLNFLAVLGLGFLLVRSLAQDKIFNFTIFDYVISVIAGPFKFLKNAIGGLSFLSNAVSDQSSGDWKKVIKGFVMALPVLIFFVVLFSSADLMFRQFTDSIISFHVSDELILRLIIILGVFLACFGAFVLVFNLIPRKEAVSIPAEVSEPIVHDRKIEVGVFLGLIAALCAVFLVFQVNYLFGGATNITDAGFTYAEYARRGFWELLVVAFTTLVILLFADTYTSKNSNRENWFTIPSLIIVGEILVFMVSAFKRLMLYQEAYGLTSLRLYVAGFIILLAVVFIILVIKLIQSKANNFFAFGALIGIIAFVACFNLMNPDKLIAKQNIERFEQTGKIDVDYLGYYLSADAVPEVLNAKGKFSPEDQQILTDLMQGKKQQLEESKDWQSYNISRKKALQLLSR